MTDRTSDFFTTLASVLLRCWLFGFVLLFIWFAAVLFAGETIYAIHGAMFELSQHELDVIFYCGMGLLKVCVLVFFFIPWLALKLVVKTPAER